MSIPLHDAAGASILRRKAQVAFEEKQTSNRKRNSQVGRKMTGALVSPLHAKTEGEVPSGSQAGCAVTRFFWFLDVEPGPK
jgi:hypothetical protein